MEFQGLKKLLDRKTSLINSNLIRVYKRLKTMSEGLLKWNF